MEAINAIYDGNNFKPIEPIPVKGKYEVVITFTKPIDTNVVKKQKILKYFGSWSNEDIDIINEIVEDRKNFSKNRVEL